MSNYVLLLINALFLSFFSVLIPILKIKTTMRSTHYSPLYSEYIWLPSLNFSPIGSYHRKTVFANFSYMRKLVLV